MGGGKGRRDYGEGVKGMSADIDDIYQEPVSCVTVRKQT